MNLAEGPAITDPSYPKWYYKQCYGIEPDVLDKEYIEWAAQLQEATPSSDATADKESETNKKEDSKSEKGSEEPPTKKKKPEPSRFCFW